MFSFLNFKKDAANSVNVNDLQSLLGTINLIDIRESYEFKNGHLPTAKNIPMGKILEDPDKYLEKNKEYYIICQSGGRSSSACNQLKRQGFNTINVAGGTGRYRGQLKK